MLFESHQRSWWFVHTQPNSPLEFTLRPIKADMNDPPTALVGFRAPRQVPCRLSMNEPPTALVGFKEHARDWNRGSSQMISERVNSDEGVIETQSS